MQVNHGLVIKSSRRNQKLSNNCPTRKKCKKVPPRPVVGLPMTTEFQEMVAVDFKFYDSKILLHLSIIIYAKQKP